MIGSFIIYREDSGHIVKCIEGTLTEYDWDSEREGYIRADNPGDMGRWLVDPASKELVPKTEIPYRLEGLTPVADSVTEFIIKDVPHGTVCEGDKIDDGELRITFDTPGVYTFELTNPLYSPTPITITVSEP